MTINAIAGVGMISVGVLGGPFLGAIQDNALDQRLKAQDPVVHATVAGEASTAYLMTYQPIDRAKVAALPEAQRQMVEDLTTANSQHTLATFAILPVIMFFCYVGLIFYFRAQGGYKPVTLATERPATAG
jgi:hypothetical protein